MKTKTHKKNSQHVDSKNTNKKTQKSQNKIPKTEPVKVIENKNTESNDEEYNQFNKALVLVEQGDPTMQKALDDAKLQSDLQQNEKNGDTLN